MREVSFLYCDVVLFRLMLFAPFISMNMFFFPFFLFSLFFNSCSIYARSFFHITLSNFIFVCNSQELQRGQNIIARELNYQKLHAMITMISTFRLLLLLFFNFSKIPFGLETTYVTLVLKTDPRITFLLL